MNADEPWQALACCMEIAAAVRSPDPTLFVSHFPVHQVPPAIRTFVQTSRSWYTGPCAFHWQAIMNLLDSQRSLKSNCHET